MAIQIDMARCKECQSFYAVMFLRNGICKRCEETPKKEVTEKEPTQENTDNKNKD